MTLTNIIGSWIADAERMHGGTATAVAVTGELFDHLMAEQATGTPAIGSVTVLVSATEVPTGKGLPSYDEMVEIAGPDRISVYVGADPGSSAFPIGLDPAMPVMFVPVPPATLEGQPALEMYNRLRWYGLGPDEAMAGSGT